MKPVASKKRATAQSRGKQMTKAPGEDEKEKQDENLSESEVEDAFFGKDQDEAAEPLLKLPKAANPKVKPMRVDPTPSEEFFGESLAKMVEELDTSEE